MYHASDITKWFHTHHLPGYTAMVRVEHVFTDKRFWAIMGILALFAGFVILAIWASKTGNTDSRIYPTIPYYPYMP